MQSHLTLRGWSCDGGCSFSSMPSFQIPQSVQIHVDQDSILINPHGCGDCAVVDSVCMYRAARAMATVSEIHAIESLSNVAVDKLIVLIRHQQS